MQRTQFEDFYLRDVAYISLFPHLSEACSDVPSLFLTFANLHTIPIFNEYFITKEMQTSKKG